jgi:hypothetical protein
MKKIPTRQPGVFAGVILKPIIDKHGNEYFEANVSFYENEIKTVTERSGIVRISKFDAARDAENIIQRFTTV